MLAQCPERNRHPEMAGNASALVTVVSAAVLHRRVALLPAEDQVLFPVQVA